MFLGWGALASFVLVVVLAVLATVPSEPLALILIIAVFTLVWWILLWTAFEGRSGAP